MKSAIILSSADLAFWILLLFKNFGVNFQNNRLFCLIKLIQYFLSLKQNFKKSLLSEISIAKSLEILTGRLEYVTRNCFCRIPSNFVLERD